MILDEDYTLSNGVKIPKLGLGTWFIRNEKVSDAVRSAVALGYRHIDTAEAYGNEEGVGEGVRTCGVPREKLFVTTKLAAEAKSYEKAVEAIDGSLKTLGLDYIDMMIIHSPQPWAMVNKSDDRCIEGNREAWKALEEAYKAGKIRAIGISNFLESDIDSLLETAEIKPMVNQLLVHVTNTPFDLIRHSEEKGMLVEAYSPMGHGVMMNHPKLLEMAARYGVNVAQLCIRYTLQLGTLPLPKTANPDHMRSNAAVDFEISEEDMKTLKEMEKIKDYGKYAKYPVYGKVR